LQAVTADVKLPWLKLQVALPKGSTKKE